MAGRNDPVGGDRDRKECSVELDGRVNRPAAVRGRAGDALMTLAGDMVRDDREGLRAVAAGDLVREGDRREGGAG